MNQLKKAIDNLAGVSELEYFNVFMIYNELNAIFHLIFKDGSVREEHLSKLEFFYENELEEVFSGFNNKGEDNNIKFKDLSLAELMDFKNTFESFCEKCEFSYGSGFFSTASIIERFYLEIKSRRVNYASHYGNFPLSTYLACTPLIHGNNPIIKDNYNLIGDELLTFVSDLKERHNHRYIIDFLSLHYPFSDHDLSSESALNMINRMSEGSLAKDINAFELKVAVKGNSHRNSGELFLLHCLYELLINNSELNLACEMIADRVEAEKEYFLPLCGDSVQKPMLTLSSDDSDAFTSAYCEYHRDISSSLNKYVKPEKAGLLNAINSALNPLACKEFSVDVTPLEISSNIAYYSARCSGSGIIVAMLSSSVRSIQDGSLAVYFMPKRESPSSNVDSVIINNAATLFDRHSDVIVMDSSDVYELGNSLSNPLDYDSILVVEYDVLSDDVCDHLTELMRLIHQQERDLSGATLTILDDADGKDRFDDLYGDYSVDLANVNRTNCGVIWAYRGLLNEDISPNFHRQFKTCVLMRSKHVPQHLDANHLSLEDIHQLKPGQSYVFKLGAPMNDAPGICYYPIHSYVDESKIYNYPNFSSEE